MVLRGSNINPELSIKEAEEAIRQAQEKLDRVRTQLESVQTETFHSLSDETLLNLNRERLITMVQELRDRVITLEQEKLEAENQFERTKLELQKTVVQFGCGGLAGAIARTTVAPIDRVKIAMQTAALKGIEDKHRTILGSARQIVKDEGFFRLWRGNFMNCVRVAPNTATQFMSYEKYKLLLMDKNNEMSVPRRLMAGALAGMTAATVTHPMDVVRIRLQTEPQLKGIWEACLHVYREAGFKTFYKGYTPAMLSLSPFIAINFATMDSLKHWYYGDVKLSKKEMKKQNPGVILCMGAVSGIVAQTCCYPLDTVRRRMQMAGKNYTSTLNAFVTIARVEGVRGYYKGMVANALKIIPNNSIRFAAYEVLKQVFVTPMKMREAQAAQAQPWRKIPEKMNA